MIDWKTAVEPLLQNNGGKKSVPMVEDVVTIANAIIENKQSFFCLENDEFYAVYVTMAGDLFSNSSSILTKENVQKVAMACHILLEFCVAHIVDNNSEPQRHLTKNRYLEVIMCLCSEYKLAQTDLNSIRATLNEKTVPFSVKTSSTDLAEVQKASAEKSSFSTVDLLDYLVDNVEVQVNYESEEEYLLALNKRALSELANLNKMFSSFANLSPLDIYLKEHKEFVESIGKPDTHYPTLPRTFAEAQAFEAGLEEVRAKVDVVANATRLNLHAPTNDNDDELQEHIDIALTCLYVGINVAVARTIVENDAEADRASATTSDGSDAKNSQLRNKAATILNDSINIYEGMASALKKSNAFGNHIYGNFQALGSCLLLQGLRVITQCMSDRRKHFPQQHDPKRRNVYSLSLSALLTKQLQEIVRNCNADTRKIVSNEKSPLGFDINKQTLPIQHFAFLSSQYELVKFLVGSVYSTFESVHSVSTNAAERLEEERSAVVDLAASDSDVSEPDPVLGKDLMTIFNDSPSIVASEDKLLASAVSSRKSNKNKQWKKDTKSAIENFSGINFSVEKLFPQFFCHQGTLQYCADVIELLADMLTSKSSIVKRYFGAKMNRALLVKLFDMLTVLDEKNTENGDTAICLLDFFQKMLVNKFVLESRSDIDNVLIALLFKDDKMKVFSKGPIQFGLYAQLLVRKQQSSKSTGNKEDSSDVTEFLDAIIEYLTAEEWSNNDVGAEVLQLAAFLFHTLDEENKAKYLLQMARSFGSLKNTGKSIAAPIRMCLLFEYVAHNYDKADANLVEQVRWNLLNVRTLLSNERTSLTRKQFDSTKKYTPFDGIVTSAHDFKAKSDEFYEIRTDTANPLQNATTEIKREVAELLASQSDYSRIYSNIAKFLRVSLDYCERVADDKNCSIVYMARYGFQVFWRLIRSLPLSDKMQMRLQNGDAVSMEEILICIDVITNRAGLIRSGSEVSDAGKAGENHKVHQLIQLTKQFFISHFFVTSAVHSSSSPSTDETVPSIAELLALNCLTRELVMRINKLKSNVNPYNDDTDLLVLASNAMLCITNHLKFHAHRSARKTSKKSEDEEDMGGWRANNMLVSNINLPCLITDLSSRSTGGDYVTTIQQPQWLLDLNKTWSILQSKAKDHKPKPDAGINDIIALHLKLFLVDHDANITTSLLLVRDFLFRLCDDIIVSLFDESMLQRLCCDFMPILACSDFDPDFKSQPLSRTIDKITEAGDLELAIFNDTSCHYVVKTIYGMLTTCFGEDDCIRDKSTACDLLHFLNQALDHANVQRACKDFFTESNETEAVDETGNQIPFIGNSQREKGDLVKLLYTIEVVDLSSYSNAMLAFLNKLCTLATTSSSLMAVCKELKRFNPDVKGLRRWVHHFQFMFQGDESDEISGDALTSLKNLSSFASNEDSLMHKDFCTTLLQAILPEESDEDNPVDDWTQLKFYSALINILISLANAHGGAGHPILLVYVLKVLNSYVAMFKKDDASKELLATIKNKPTEPVSSCSQLLLYVGDILKALQDTQDEGESDCNDDDDDEEEAALNLESEFDDNDGCDRFNNDSDAALLSGNDDANLWSKLCTYTVTQKKFMNQHWYHCHTCKMLDGVGVCSVCAKVCHKNHDLTYSKFGSFFCDCGAKEPKVCKALVKRIPGSDKIASGVSAFSNFASQPPPPNNSSSWDDAMVIRNSSRTSVKTSGSKDLKPVEKSGKKEARASRLREKCMELTVSAKKDELLSIVSSLNDDDTNASLQVDETLLSMLKTMLGFVSSDQYKLNSNNSTQKAVKVMADLKSKKKTTEFLDTLLVPTLGSQEGAFENVKPNYAGEQGQVIRQHINSKTLRRVSMCCVAPTTGTQQYLAVSHDKGKVTLLQLGTLLKQADASKRKLTLTRLSTTAMPFTVVTIAANPSNDEVLAVCGLKDCHVLSFASTSAPTAQAGTVVQHLVLHPQLANNNYIIRAVWLPASPSMLAIITAEFIKIYDLAKDVLSPAYYFLIPTGKIRGATFVGGLQDDRETHIITMSTSGFIYSQQLCEESLAIHGTFFMTNVLHLAHESVKELNGQQGSGGIAVYYSHMLGLLFFSYTNGRTFAATLTPQVDAIQDLFPIEYKPSSSQARNHALYEFAEVAQHPGLVTCFSHTTGCPVVIMVEPGRFVIQEIKGNSSSKAKIQDVVAVRHHSSSRKEDTNAERTTVIVLCDDGSLRIYLVSTNACGFWTDPSLRPNAILGKRKVKKKVSQVALQTEQSGADVKMPVDFFEFCQLVGSNDLEFDGDLLEVYNKAQLKTRFSGHGTYVSFRMPYTLTIKIKSTNALIAGIRISLGAQGDKKAPNSITIGSRVVTFSPARLTRERWFDVPLTSEESVKYQNELKIKVSKSNASDGTIVIDGLRVYCKNKELFGISNDDEASDGAKKEEENNDDFDSDMSTTRSLEVCDEIISASMLAMERLIKNSVTKPIKTQSLVSSLRTSSEILTESVLPTVRGDAKKLIALMFKNKKDFYSYQDTMLVKRAYGKFLQQDLDVETFQRMLLYVSHIARKRPYNLSLPVDGSAATDLIETDWHEACADFELPISTRKYFGFVSKDFHKNFIECLMEAFWRLLSQKPRSRNLAPPCLPGLTRVDITVRVLIDIIHAISACSPETLETVTDIYYKLLTHPNVHVSYSAKSALVGLLQVKEPRKSRKKDGKKTLATTNTTGGDDTPVSTRSATPPSNTSSSNNTRTTTTTAANAGGVAIDQTVSRVSTSRDTTDGTIGEEDDIEIMEDDEDEDLNQHHVDEEDDEEDGNQFANIAEESIDSDEQQFLDQLENSAPVFYNVQDDLAQMAAELADHRVVVDEDDGEDDDDDEDVDAEGFIARMQQQQRRQEDDDDDDDDEDDESRELVESGTFNLDVMQAMAGEEGDDDEDAVLIDEMDIAEHDIENVLLGQDEEAMMELAIALSLRQENQAAAAQQRPNRAARGSANWAAVARQGDEREGNEEQVVEHVDDEEDIEDEEQPDQVGGVEAVDVNGSRYFDDSLDGSDAGEADASANLPITTVPAFNSVDQSSSQADLNVEENLSASSKTNLKQDEENSGKIGSERMLEIRLTLLERLYNKLEQVEKLGGEKAIPYFQVVIMLIQTLDMSKAECVGWHSTIVLGIMSRLRDQCFDADSDNSISHEGTQHEVFLLMFRLLNVLMSKVSESSKSASLAEGGKKMCIYNKTAVILKEKKILGLCLHILETLYHDHWKRHKSEEVDKANATGVSDAANPEGLLRGTQRHVIADMSPFFLHQYTRSHAGEIFRPYKRLITEMALHVAYQVRKQYATNLSATSSEETFGEKWKKLLSDYMLFAGIPSVVRARTRKLLLYITGSKEKYREERDTHALKSYMRKSSQLCKWSSDGAEANTGYLNLSYDELIELVETVKKWSDIARSRPHNWQKFCVETPDSLQFLLHVSVYSDENVATIALKLLLSATTAPPSLANSSATDAKPSKKNSTQKAAAASKVLSKEGVRKKEEWSAMLVMSHKLSCLLLNGIDDSHLSDFIRHFLLEMNSTCIRWSAHALVLNLFKNSTETGQSRVLSAMWSLWPCVVNFGKKSAQFVDLIGYLTLKSKISQSEASSYADSALRVLQEANELVSNHPNAILYSQLAVYVNFDGYYLENNPCMVCNQIESPFSNIKLSSIRSEIRYTTTQLITKLVGSYAVQKATIKVTDIKRTKMIRTAVLYYNNKKVCAIVDLKNKPEMWNKAKSITVPQGESDIVFDLPLPVVATNLMIEFSDFYENISASMETLQCPRCSASVQANPGVCGNCGENVFQCHKCRSINYDEKDPFLCNMCGFSKYAKFEVSFKARTCFAVDTIDNDEGRKKMVDNVVSLLGKADNAYNLLSGIKPQLESLIFKISSASYEGGSLANQAGVKGNGVANQQLGDKNKIAGRPITFAAVTASGTVNANQNTTNAQNTTVNSSIQQLAKKYCQDCKGMFDELANLVRTVLASRNEILAYDRRRRMAMGGGCDDSKHLAAASISYSQSATDCYGCASAIAEQTITLMRVLAVNRESKPHLVERGVVQELVAFNMKRGEGRTRKHVHTLIGQLVRNNPTGTDQLNGILLKRIVSAIRHHQDDLPSIAVASEMQLLTSMLALKDDLWQTRLRTVMQLFQLTVYNRSPSVVENVTLPCLNILRNMVSIPKSPETIAINSKFNMDFTHWMKEDKAQEFSSWKKQVDIHKTTSSTSSSSTLVMDKEEVRQLYLQEKYVKRWRDNIDSRKQNDHIEGGPSKHLMEGDLITQHSLLRTMLFCPSSKSVRQSACSMINSLSQIASRKPQILDLLTSFLEELGEAGEAANEFMTLYQEQIAPITSKVYLVARGVLPPIGCLIQKEIRKLSELEETTLNLNLQQGYALKELTELLFEFAQEVPYIHADEKCKLVRIVLDSYLSLRRLVLQRTNLVDSAQELMLVLLEDLTTGTEAETRSFMALCIEAIKKQNMNDHQIPQFIFERLANIIYPEETDTGEFFMSLDKCPLQEDFLQGRMVGNPYSSNVPGLGPLMRDVKNKICRDCDLIALLEDDSGMELLVNNKIISLDLPVRDVYKKVWLQDHAEDDSMHVVYRMRGLLGEATEDMIEQLDSDKSEDDEEEVYKLASVLGECGGIEVTLHRLESVKNVKHGRQLIDVILKLLSYAVKLKSNRQYLARPSLNTLNVLLGSLLSGLQQEEEGVEVVEQILEIMWIVLYEAAQSESELTGDKERLQLLLAKIDSEFVQSHTNVLQGILKIIPFLSFGDVDLMQMLIDHFITTLDFEKYDEGGCDDGCTVYLNCFCDIVAGIQVNANGDQLKDLMIENNIVGDALAYIDRHTPNHKNFESDDWKKLTQRKGIPLCLRMLTGLCTQHRRIQELVGESIPGLHRIEQISSEEGIGTHAENVLEKLMDNPEIAKVVKQVRRETRMEKKRKAMKVREKQLGALGMHTNEKGQVLSKSSILKQMTELVEETGLTCIICREGYKYEPKKVLGIYTYTRKCALEEYENKARKTQGYSSVSHFNVVHYDCHTAAVRSARGREEWESALLQNANTKCNGLLPLWGPQVPESAFASCLARHNTYIQEAASSQREPSIHSTVHDFKLLLLRFANEKSFSEESGGGGKQSNINLAPYIIHAGLYVINTTRNQSREERNLEGFLSAPKDQWVASAYEVDGPMYFGSLMAFVSGKNNWKEQRVYLLRRIVVTCHARNESQSAITSLKKSQLLDFEAYKPYLLFWALLDTIINIHFKHVANDADSVKLANYIRHNDSQLMEQGEKTLKHLQENLIPCASGDELMDVMSLLDEVPSFNEFVLATLRSLS